MACNCKRKAEIEKKYGVKVKETIFRKGYRYFMKVVMTAIVIVLSLAITPIMALYVIFAVLFKKDKAIVLPKILGKYLK
jgi:hypothetical protein